MSPPQRDSQTKPAHEVARAKLIHEALTTVLNRRPGVSIGAAIRAASTAYHGRRLPGGRRLQASPGTLCRHWYVWIHNPSPTAFALRYGAPPGTEKHLPRWAEFLLLRWAVEEGLTPTDAHRILSRIAGEALPFSVRTVYRRFSRTRLRAYLRTRRAFSRAHLGVARELASYCECARRPAGAAGEKQRSGRRAEGGRK